MTERLRGGEVVLGLSDMRKIPGLFQNRYQPLRIFIVVFLHFSDLLYTHYSPFRNTPIYPHCKV